MNNELREQINELIDILKNSLHSNRVKESLKAINFILESDNTQNEFLLKYYLKIGNIIINNVIENWLTFFNNDEINILYYYFIGIKNSYPISLLCISEYLKKIHPSKYHQKLNQNEEFFIYILSKLLSRESFKDIFIIISSSEYLIYF